MLVLNAFFQLGDPEMEHQFKFEEWVEPLS